MKQFNLLEVASVSFDHLEAPSAWLGHLPFANWLIQRVRPKIFVELGTHYGHSYFAFCKSVVEAKYPAKCYAVDTWQGDAHAGEYGDAVFCKVNAYHQRHYAHFSRLLRTTFDEAATYFSDKSIDLLHIDGLHTYEAVRHDFQTWLPKLAPGAIVLFHDTNVRERDFGVWRLWEELRELYPNNLEFTHSYGLGVIQLNDSPSEREQNWLRPDFTEKNLLIDYFASLGKRQQDLYELAQAKAHAESLHEQLDKLKQEHAEQDQQLSRLGQAIADRDEQIKAANQLALENAGRLQDVYSSTSWRATKPLRSISTSIARSRQLASRVAPSRLKRLAQLIRPHMVAMYQDPSLFRRKAQTIWLGWKSGGTREVVRRLQQSYAIRNGTLIGTVDGEVERHMRELIALPTQPINAALPNHREVAIIVPVYRGVSETRRCIESVIKSFNNSAYRLIVINDASPEPEVEDYLNSIAGTSPHIEVLHNQENLGFVETVNRGMRLAGAADVVLLNSDTVVANDWLDRMVAQAYADERIGTVTPFSNNATICSYPDLDGWSSLPLGETVERLDTCFAAANPGCAVELPTAVGFCMYIKRACLQEVGLFDTETFGKGYGEENDFCLRASKGGWRHLLAADVFVFHEGEVSFSESATSKKADAMKIIRRLYPDYETSVAKHISTNAAHIYRLRATAARYRSGNSPVVLFITHSYGGGTEKHVQELAQRLSEDNCRVLYLRSQPTANGFDATLESHEKCDRLFLRLTSHDICLLADVLGAFGITDVQIHHAHGFPFEVESLMTLMGVNYDITIHDFYTICPRINFFMPGKGYCGNPSNDDCNKCLVQEPKVGNEMEIEWWRAKSMSLLNGANHVYCPSNDAADRILKYFPAAAVSVVPHETFPVPPACYATTPRNVRRFALLGVLAEHKGLSLVEAVLATIRSKKLAVELVLIGYTERALKDSNFSQTGPYNDDELLALIERVDPDAILFPAQCPETYSYTLSAAIRSGRPIVVSDLGALPERVQGLDRAYIFPYTLSPSQLADYLVSLPLNPTVQSQNASVAISQ